MSNLQLMSFPFDREDIQFECFVFLHWSILVRGPERIVAHVLDRGDLRPLI